MPKPKVQNITTFRSEILISIHTHIVLISSSKVGQIKDCRDLGIRKMEGTNLTIPPKLGWSLASNLIELGFKSSNQFT